MVSNLVGNTELFLAAKQLFYNIFQKEQVTSLVLRLAFHDACTYCQKTKTGGPNARIVFEQEITHSVNKGLAQILEKVQAIKKEIPLLGLADLIQLGGYAAVEYTQGPKMSHLFKFGRKDVSDQDYFNERFYIAPNDNPKDEIVRIIQKYGPFSSRFVLDANKGVYQIRDIFKKIGFNEQEIVALFGGNSIARAFIDRSKMDDNLIQSPLIFDNSYFIELLEGKETTRKQTASDLALLATNEFRM